MRVIFVLMLTLFIWGCDGDVTVGQGVDGASGVNDQGNVAFDDDDDDFDELDLIGIIVPAPAPAEQCQAGTGFRIPGGGWCSCESRQAGRC